MDIASQRQQATAELEGKVVGAAMGLLLLQPRQILLISSCPLPQGVERLRRHRLLEHLLHGKVVRLHRHCRSAAAALVRRAVVEQPRASLEHKRRKQLPIKLLVATLKPLEGHEVGPAPARAVESAGEKDDCEERRVEEERDDTGGGRSVLAEPIMGHEEGGIEQMWRQRGRPWRRWWRRWRRWWRPG